MMGKLRDALLREAAEDEQKQLAEIVSGAGEPAHRRGGFSRACGESRTTMIREQVEKAINELAAKPSLVRTELGEAEFRNHYAAIPAEKLSAIIAEAKRG